LQLGRKEILHVGLGKERQYIIPPLWGGGIFHVGKVGERIGKPSGVKLQGRAQAHQPGYIP
jgi:hypothetical protein